MPGYQREPVCAQISGAKVLANPSTSQMGTSAGSVGSAEMESRPCLPLRPRLPLRLPERTTSPHPHGSRGVQMPP